MERRAIVIRGIILAVAREVSQGVGVALIAWRFHSTLVDVIATGYDCARAETGRVVVLNGGVFLNALLTSQVSERLG